MIVTKYSLQIDIHKVVMFNIRARKKKKSCVKKHTITVYTFDSFSKVYTYCFKKKNDDYNFNKIQTYEKGFIHFLYS